MRQLEEDSEGLLAGLVSRPEPLLPFSEEVFKCWAWCDGWNPERLLMYLEVFGGAEHFHEFMEGLMTVRQTVTEQQLDED